MGFPAIEDRAPEELRRWGQDIALLAFAAGGGFGLLLGGSELSQLRWYYVSALVVAFLVAVAYQLRKGPRGRTGDPGAQAPSTSGTRPPAA
jgi:hypothetical protein